MKRPVILLTQKKIDGFTALFGRSPFGAGSDTLVVHGGSTDRTLDYCYPEF